MISIITEKNEQLEKFFNKEECTRIGNFVVKLLNDLIFFYKVDQLGKCVWIVTDVRNGKWNGVLLYRFVTSYLNIDFADQGVK